MKHTKETLAALLNGREYMDEITAEECKSVKENGLVVIFGSLDYLCEIRGVIDDEIIAKDGDNISICKTGIFPSIDRHHCSCKFCGYQAKADMCKAIEALWSREGYTWTYKTDIPHATFDIMEDGEKYCRGIVIDINDLPEA